MTADRCPQSSSEPGSLGVAATRTQEHTVIANGLDLVLAVVLVSYGVIGYRHGFVVSVMSLVGFLAGGALGMWLLPELLRHWDTVDNNVVWRTLVLVLGVFVFAALGQAIAVGVGSRLRSGLKDEPERLADSALGAVATVLAVSVLVWFLAGAVRGGAHTPLTKAIGTSRIVSTIDRFVPPQTARLFAGFQSVLDREGFPGSSRASGPSRSLPSRHRTTSWRSARVWPGPPSPSSRSPAWPHRATGSRRAAVGSLHPSGS